MLLVASGQGSHWLTKNPIIIHLCVVTFFMIIKYLKSFYLVSSLSLMLLNNIATYIETVMCSQSNVQSSRRTKSQKEETETFK